MYLRSRVRWETEKEDNKDRSGSIVLKNFRANETFKDHKKKRGCRLIIEKGIYTQGLLEEWTPNTKV